MIKCTEHGVDKNPSAIITGKDTVYCFACCQSHIIKKEA